METISYGTSLHNRYVHPGSFKIPFLCDGYWFSATSWGERYNECGVTTASPVTGQCDIRECPVTSKYGP
jgi:hypothetical protein